jgi:predicted AlkP superfamily pyrophosphatase or phosphodiesterase
MCHRRWLISCLLACAAASGLATAGEPPGKPFVVLISVDGLKPEAIIEAARHGLKVPNLRAFLADGAYATGVHGVMPTLTYPSHMTILTGVSPDRHGIYANTTFDPYGRNEHGWYWYAEDVRVPTLWDAAAQAGLRTANVYWPTSVGANITYNLPQIWRTGTEDDRKLQRALGTPGLERQLSASLGRYPGGMEETVAEDEIRARFAMRLMQTRRPDFMTVYLTGLDTEQHHSGPFSIQSNEVLERIDAIVGSLRVESEKIAPGRATICVVSDHGFAAVAHDVNLYAAFLDAGLFSADAAHKISAWKAMPWPAGGGAAIMLADPEDGAVRTQVTELLNTLAADPANGIDRVLTPAEIAQRHGFPDAAFFVSFRIGYEFGSSFLLPLISSPSNLGMHGYLPDQSEMRSAFFLIGPGIAARRALGEIDMRQIAPTLANILKISLKDAELGPLQLN